MSDDLIRKYLSKELLELQATSIALADISFKIIWYNKSFKQEIGPGKIKGSSLKTLFNINTPDQNNIPNSSGSFVVPIADKNKNIVITPLLSKIKEAELYFIEMLPLVDSDFQQSAEKEKLRRNLLPERVTKYFGFNC